MKKIPCLFQRDFTDQRNPILLDAVTPGCEWALTEGIATRKYDGTACAVIDGRLYARYDAKRGSTPPVEAIPCDDADPVTGHHPHWVLADGADYQYIREAAEFCGNGTMLEEGTYEACGPKINGNREKLSYHTVFRHGFTLIKPGYIFDISKDSLGACRMTDPIRTALSQIASTSPVLRMLPNGTEERCLHCRALIDLAREALGHQPWPAAAGTAIETTTKEAPMDNSFHMDGKLIANTDKVLTCSQVMAMSGVDQSFNLILQGPINGADALVDRWGQLEVKGKSFYSIPPATSA